MRVPVLLTAAFAAAALTATPARADVDIEVPVPAKLRGTLSAGEVETVRFFAPRGSLLQVKLKTKKKDGVDPDLRVLDPDGAELALPAGNVKDKGAAILVKKLPLDRSGVWAVEVTGGGTGEYKLAVKAKAPKKISDDVEVGGEPAEIVLPVVLGSTLEITAKAGKGSPADPVLESLDGMDLTDAGKRKPGLHKATVEADASGDLVLRVGGDGEGGAVGVTVKIKPPKTKAVNEDVRAATLGRPSGGETAVGKVISPAAGGSIAAGPASDLLGAAVDVPAGALSKPTLISLRSADLERLVDRDDANAGPTVELLPSGLRFNQPVTVTVPIDVLSLPIQTTADDITVLIVEDDGSSREVVPTSVDLDAGTCTVQVSGFSRFSAVAPAGSPPLAGRSYWGFALDANLEPDFGGRNESGVRRVFRASALLDFSTDGESFTALFRERESVFGIVRGQDDELMPVQDTFGGTFEETGTWSYAPDGRAVHLLPDSEEDDDRIFVSRDGSVLLNTVEEADEQRTPFDALLDVFVERPEVTDPTSLLVGTYHFGELAVFFQPQENEGLLELELFRTHGTLTFKANGTLVADLNQVEAFGFARQGPGAFEFRESRERATVTWSVDPTGDFAGSILVDAGDEDTFRLFPHRDGRMFVAVLESDGETSVLIGVRRSEGRVPSDLVGEHAAGTFFVRPQEYQIENGFPGSGRTLFVPDFALASESSRVSFDGSSTVTLDVRGSFYEERDPQSQDGILRDTSTGPPESVGYRLRADGRLEFVIDQGELRGGVTPDGSFGFAVQDPDVPETGFVLFVDRPPEQP